MKRFFRRLLSDTVALEDDTDTALAAKIESGILKRAAQETCREAGIVDEKAKQINIQNNFSAGLAKAFLRREEDDR